MSCHRGEGEPRNNGVITRATLPFRMRCPQAFDWSPVSTLTRRTASTCGPRHHCGCGASRILADTKKKKHMAVTVSLTAVNCHFYRRRVTVQEVPSTRILVVFVPNGLYCDSCSFFFSWLKSGSIECEYAPLFFVCDVFTCILLFFYVCNSCKYIYNTQNLKKTEQPSLLNEISQKYFNLVY